MHPRTTLAIALLAVSASTLAACGGGSKPVAAPSSPTPTPTATTAPAAPAVVATCPLTGVPPTKGQKIQRVALAVKIDNVDVARPQTGLDHADIVVEETVEGGLTRLFAVFQCDSAPLIGPIRSARTSDGDLLRLLNGAVFGFSGANPRALAPVAATSKAVLISYDALPAYYHRDYSRPAPHNVYSSTQSILSAGVARRKGLHAPSPIFAYGPPRALGAKVHQASLAWPAASASWRWNGRVWLRTQNGSADMLTDGKRVGANNVVIMSITTRSTGLHDVLGNASPDDVVTGSGKVWVLRDGHVIRGTWSRADRTKRMVLKGLGGKVILLHPGRTWVELLPQPRKPNLS
jgi:hypothetical protein